MRIGCIADDFTGASDAASFLSAAGMRTLLYSGIPRDIPEDAQAAVIALKTRTMETGQAVAQSREALERLMAAGAETLYVKYCSTFDSTKTGNIGPICDMALEVTRRRWTVLCPALPVNGRTVREGRLYVGGVPLEQSAMREHPLTPMWDSRIAELMRGQSKYPVFSLSQDDMADARRAIRALEERCEGRFYVVPDYETDAQGAAIAEAFSDLTLYTGGSGLLGALGAKWGGGHAPVALPGVRSAALVLAGSCSVATRGQIACWVKSGRARVHMDAQALTRDEQGEMERLYRVVREHADGEVLIDSSASAEGVLAGASERVERAMAALAVYARTLGYRHVIVAGGETSGAVTRALGYAAFLTGESIAPGVPVIAPIENDGMRLALKSGNFGQEDFFLRALQATGGTDHDAA